MASKFLRLNRNFLLARPTARLTSTPPCALRLGITSTNDLSNHNTTRPFSQTPQPALQIDSTFISQITAAEKAITGSDKPVANGPTAKAQAHAGQTLTGSIIHDITMAERAITGREDAVKGGPTSIAQSALTSGNSPNNNNNNNNNNNAANATTSSHSGTLDSTTLHKITEAEKKLTGQDGPVKDGPTAHAQSHANEPITSQALHDITVGEKKVTGGERVKGGPTATAQSELSKSRA